MDATKGGFFTSKTSENYKTSHFFYSPSQKGFGRKKKIREKKEKEERKGRGKKVCRTNLTQGSGDSHREGEKRKRQGKKPGITPPSRRSRAELPDGEKPPLCLRCVVPRTGYIFGTGRQNPALLTRFAARAPPASRRWEPAAAPFPHSGHTPALTEHFRQKNTKNRHFPNRQPPPTPLRAEGHG